MDGDGNHDALVRSVQDILAGLELVHSLCISCKYYSGRRFRFMNSSSFCATVAFAGLAAGSLEQMDSISVQCASFKLSGLLGRRPRLNNTLTTLSPRYLAGESMGYTHSKRVDIGRARTT